MLSGLRKLRVRSALRCHAAIQIYGTSPTFPSSRRFVATSTATKSTNNMSSVSKSLEDYGNKTTIVDYIGDRYAGNMHGLGMITYLNGDTYEGQLEHNQRHGYGKFVSNDGYIYQGEWLNDSMHGSGTMYYDTGDIYNGRFQDNIRRGHGRTVYYKSKSVYEGEFNDRPHGWGELTLANGDKYEGEFSDGWKSGFGTFSAADGSHYEGEWRRNLKHGRGKDYALNGDVYVGMHHEGLKAGEGEMTYADGSSYVGQWAADKPHGTGVLTQTTGEVFQGIFVRGVYSAVQSQLLHDKVTTSGFTESSTNSAAAPGVSEHDEPTPVPRISVAAPFPVPTLSAGVSVVFDASGTTGIIQYPPKDLRCTYTGGLTPSGQSHGPGKITNRDGSIWEGIFQNGHPFTGEGSHVNKKNGQVEVGSWKKGKFLGTEVHEKTTVSVPNEELLLMYEGEGRNGMRHGRGKIIHPDGLTQEGEFRAGKLIGQLWDVIV